MPNCISNYKLKKEYKGERYGFGVPLSYNFKDTLYILYILYIMVNIFSLLQFRQLENRCNLIRTK